MFATKLQTVLLATILFLSVPPVVLTPPTAFAQTKVPVQFQQGKSSAILNGTIIGKEYIDYVLRARGGQTMSVALTVTGTNGSGSVFFNILPPGSSNEAIYNGSTSPNQPGEVRLLRDGDYTIRVYQMGDDRDTGKTSGYKVSVKIQSPGNTGASRPSSSERAGQGIYDATGNVPCAQYKGQPMSECPFGVARDGNGSATIVITHPDGRKRFISFQNGKAIGADLSQADGDMTFSATKESDLYIIRAGNERYEIPEAVVFGG